MTPPLLKVCGLRSLDDSLACLDAGADWLGFNFYPKSKRHLPPSVATKWLGQLAGKTTRVGLFVNASADEIRAIWDHGILDLVQLHGDEDFEFCHRLQSHGIALMKAFRIGNPTDLDPISDFPCDDVLLDASVQGEFGGTGQETDWSLAATAVQRFPSRRIFLAGGISPNNAAAAVEKVMPHGIDVASGVESSPGVKDPSKVRQLASALGKI